MKSAPRTISVLPRQSPTSRSPERMEHQSHQRSNAPPEEKAENKSFKDLVLNFMEYTTAHGIGRLAASQTLFWKVFWSMCCIGAFGMFVYQATGLFEQYLSKPISTSMSVTFEKVCLNRKSFHTLWFYVFKRSVCFKLSALFV